MSGEMGVVFYQITHNRKIKQITTRLHVAPSNWDNVRGGLISITGTNLITHNRIKSDIAILKRVISDLKNSCTEYSINDIIKRYKSPAYQTLAFDYFDQEIKKLRAANRFGTAKNYEKTISSFRRFIQNAELPLSAITEQTIEDYNAFLIKRGLVRNSISFYMRVLRAIYNRAVKQKIIEQQNPFTEVYTGIDHTRKRAVSESIILQINRLKIPDGSPLALCRDVFIFSYCTRGMAFVDIAYLRKENIQNGTICYIRRKTGQLLTIRIEPNIERIIDKYANKSPFYIFPILSSLDAETAYVQYQTALNTHNRLLGRLSKILNCGCKLTSYTPRHSWATAARNHNVPISVISQGMGHTSEQTTQIYLKMLENTIIDEANKRIIECLK